MSAVCFIELWPEGKKCKNDLSLAKGVILGSALMLGTLSSAYKEMKYLCIS